TDEVFGVRLANTAVVFDLVVEDWLGHRWVIRLVVTAEAVANQVDEDILAEAATVLGGQLTYPDNSFWVVAIDVEDWAVKALGQVSGVVGRTRRVRGSGETDLVIDYHVYRTAGGVTTQLRQVDGFLDNAQACEGCIAVQHQRNDGVAVFALVENILLSAGHTN